MRFGLVAVSVLVTAAIITLYLRRYGLSTLAVEHEAIRGWLAGDGLYAYRSPENESGAALPPALALIVAPLTLLPLSAAGGLLALAGLAALLLSTMIIAGPVARRHGRRRGLFVLVAAGLALLAEPVRAAIGLGRPELVILALLAADLVGLRRAARVRDRSLAALLRSRRSPRARSSRSGGADRPHRAWIVHAFRAALFSSATRHASNDARHVSGDARHASNDARHASNDARHVSGDARHASSDARHVSGDARHVSSAAHHGESSKRSRREIEPSGNGWKRLAASGSWAGVGTGLAVTFSATALLFVGYLLVTRQRRAALTALATAALVTVGMLAVAPAETLTWYGTTMWELARPAPVSDVDNQSLAGMMARLYGFPAPPVLVWFAFGILIVAVGLIRARSAHTEGDEVAAYTLIGLTAAVASPVTTAAESLWLLPAVLILADTGLRRRLTLRPARPSRWIHRTGAGHLAAAIVGYLLLVTEPDWALRWNVPALALILLVNALPWRQGAPAALATARPAPHRRAAIPLPRGG
ncbi:glycosyltransferase 87 family protein [Actinoplanes philippinensis]|uniref:glycosyltransferase 87 family protein n=1 Tax=Actinoplanes philippinensis TaxID=35752 RepID=UPI0033E9D328